MTKTRNGGLRQRFAVRRSGPAPRVGASSGGEARFLALVEASLQGVVVHRGGRPLLVNDAFAAIHGFGSGAEVLALASVAALLAPAGPHPAGGAGGLEPRGRGRDGAPWVLSRVRTLDWQGAPAELVCQIDLSECKRLETALATSEGELSSYFDGPMAGIGVLSVDGRLMRCNEMLGRLMGCAPGKLLGLSFRDVTAPEYLGASGVAYQRLLAGEVERLTFEKRYRRPDGSQFEGEVTLVCVRDNLGRAAYMVAMIQDISQRKLVERELRLAKEAADRANAAKTRFLAAASHDLRQPLMALAMFISALDVTNRAPELAPLIRKIKSSADELAALLDALLDISRLDADLITPAPSAFPLAPQLERLGREFAPLARAAGLRLRVVPSSLAATTDAVLLGTILRNLMSNAVRYTERGGIVLGARRCGERVRIEVWDTGIGIAEGDIDLIFQEFHQVHNRGRNRTLGLGLGLAMVARLARLLGLRVVVRSVPQRGSVFSVELPRAAAGQVGVEAVLEEVEEPEGGALIGVVEDEESVRDSLRTVLECWGYRAVAAGSDQALLEALAEVGETPDLLIADFRLGTGRDGVELVSFLRRELDRPFPALLLTGDTAPDRLRQAKASGLPLLHKPVKDTELKKTIASLLAPPQAS